MALADNTQAVQSASTAGVAGFAGGYIINVYNVLATVVGTYAHHIVDSIQANALIITDDIKVGLAAAVGGYVLHRLNLADEANRLTPTERTQVRSMIGATFSGPQPDAPDRLAAMGAGTPGAGQADAGATAATGEGEGRGQVSQQGGETRASP